MRSLQFFNTETKKKEPFEPYAPNHVKMYTCGPTVYNFAHIGNFRTYVFEDILRRTLKFFGYQVNQVMNLTDVDDKTIRGAIEKNLPLLEFTQPYKNAFFVDLSVLGIDRVENYPAATDYIPHMIDFIQKLLDRGFAYKSADRSIYFSIEKFPRYGCLSHLKLDELKLGAGDARVLIGDEYDKENASDFVLWKAYDPERDGHIFWESPFGKGRPGWHLECSTMAIQLLGPKLDIHVGAVDNIFPHHENEIAQSEACTGELFVKYWLHSEHLLVDHKKMSKSLGNFYTLRDLLDKGYEGKEIRYLLMQTHYRTQLNFTFESLEGAKRSLARLNDFIQRIQQISHCGEATPFLQKILQKALVAFSEAMADDLNISVALSAIFDMMYEINLLESNYSLTIEDAALILNMLHQFNRVLNVFSFDALAHIPPQFLDWLSQRDEARAQKNWKEADRLRHALLEQGYLIEDTPQGSRLKKNDKR